MNNWFIVAQIFGVFTMIFEFLCYQVSRKNDNSRYFLLTGIGSLFWALMFVAIGFATSMDTQLSLILAGTYSTIRNLVFFKMFKKNTPRSKKAARSFLIVMLVIGLVAGTMTVLQAPEQVRWLHALGLVTALLFVVCQYLPGDHYVRISVVFYAFVVLLTQTPINILYGDFRWNIMGILIESSKIISVLVFYGMEVWRKRRARNLQTMRHVIREELAKIEVLADMMPIENIPAVNQVEAKMAKMVREEIKIMQTSEITDVKTAEGELEDLMQDLKLMERLKRMRLKEARIMGTT